MGRPPKPKSEWCHTRLSWNAQAFVVGKRIFHNQPYRQIWAKGLREYCERLCPKTQDCGTKKKGTACDDLPASSDTVRRVVQDYQKAPENIKRALEKTFQQQLPGLDVQSMPATVDIATAPMIATAKREHSEDIRQVLTKLEEQVEHVAEYPWCVWKDYLPHTEEVWWEDKWEEWTYRLKHIGTGWTFTCPVEEDPLFAHLQAHFPGIVKVYSDWKSNVVKLLNQGSSSAIPELAEQATIGLTNEIRQAVRKRTLHRRCERCP